MKKYNKNKYINFFNLIILFSLFSSFSQGSDPVKEQAQSGNRYYEALVEARKKTGKVTVEQENQLREEHIYPADKKFLTRYSESYHKAMSEAKLKRVSEADFKKNKELPHWDRVLDIKNPPKETDQKSPDGKTARKLAQKKPAAAGAQKSSLQAVPVEGGGEVIQFPAPSKKN